MYNQIYPKKKRAKIICRKIFILLYNLAKMITVILMETIFWDKWSVDCIKTINIWLVVYGVIQAVITISNVIAILFWALANDPNLAETRLKVFF